MSPPPGRHGPRSGPLPGREGSLPLGGKARSAKGVPPHAFALLDDCRATAASPTSRLYTGFVHERRCDDAATLDATCAAAGADLAAGLHAVLLADYEWGARLLQAGDRQIAAADAGAMRLLMFERCERMSRPQVDAWLASHDRPGEPSPAGFVELHPSIDRAAFDAAIVRIHELIRAGETYQVNFTYRIDGRAFGTPAALYRRLRASQPVEFGAWIVRPDGGAVMSCSPELFVRRHGGRIAARPMKGTARREPVAEGDSETARWLGGDAKNRAENLMIVDLLRNDLGRIAATGSVRVPVLFALEPYRTVLQMTSTVEAALPAATSFAAVLRALYPCGSVTGAPKHHTMECIARLESTPRGLYTGAIGWLDAPRDERACGDFCLSVPIRTLVLDERGGCRLGVGAGIVHDSVAADEWDECALKARFATALDPGITLFETMRAGREGVPLLDEHLARLAASARVLGFAFDSVAVRGRVAAALKELPADGAHRMRIDLDHRGGIGVRTSSLASLCTPVSLRIAAAPLPAAEAALAQHKTSLRSTYDAASADAERAGAFDTLFFDAAGELTEGARSSVFVRLDGRWCTPPLDGRLLPGVMRARVLADPAWQAGERRLALADLQRADALMVCNALRGVLPARLAGTAPR